MKIALIGMPTSGKSTISKLIANGLEYALIDVDQLLEKKFQMTLQNFINLEGEEEFIRQENLLLKSIKYPKNSVISTGGSVIYATEAMERMKANGVHFIYLNVPISILKKRLESQRNMRGIVMNGATTWDELLDDRDKLYQYYADTIIDTNFKSAFEIYEEIASTVIHKGT